ncbi:MAG: hypothetical protein IR158_19090 [Cellulomonas sp.]|uniref:hypothetical protein n=1 Tax=Cellulomonas sp. TaxID=40001 RepID=UPI0019E8C15E|nr:hypothetical protein [Cellulomonas sp.]MBF0689866.1 hypothetical protein [Cellulomonas sp.]
MALLDTMCLDVREVRVRVADGAAADGLTDWERVELARRYRRSMVASEQELSDVAEWLRRKRAALV